MRRRSERLQSVFPIREGPGGEISQATSKYGPCCPRQLSEFIIDWPSGGRVKDRSLRVSKVLNEERLPYATSAPDEPDTPAALSIPPPLKKRQFVSTINE